MKKNFHPSEFRRPWWLPSAHLETIYAAFNKTPAVRYQRHIAHSRENDEIALDYISGLPQYPLLVIFHGLEGCSQSRLMRLLASGFSMLGWSVAVPHFRSCGGHMNRFPRAYHAADVDDAGWMLNYCDKFLPHQQLFAAGVSLGGTVLINYLTGNRTLTPTAATTVSAPFDLTACATAIDRGLNRRIYARHFLKTLRVKIAQKSKHYPALGDTAAKLRKARTLGEFDSLFTAPIHGFADAQDYWRRASPRDSLAKISCPTLCINALNDPIVPPQALSETRHERITYCRPQQGGHSGFFGIPKNWLFETVRQFFALHTPDAKNKGNQT